MARRWLPGWSRGEVWPNFTLGATGEVTGVTSPAQIRFLTPSYWFITPDVVEFFLTWSPGGYSRPVRA